MTALCSPDPMVLLQVLESDPMMNRRDAVGKGLFSAALAASTFFPSGALADGATEMFPTLPPLPYDYAALEPHIDEATMKFHHDKHYNAYRTNLNKALEGKEKVMLTDLQTGAIKAGAALRNNGGGFYNHGLFFNSLAPAGKGN